MSSLSWLELSDTAELDGSLSREKGRKEGRKEGRKGVWSLASWSGRK